MSEKKTKMAAHGGERARASLHDPGLLFTQGRVTAESAKN